MNETGPERKLPLLLESLINRFNSAKKTANIRPIELVTEMSRLANEGDGQGLNDLFQAYYNWELREAATPENEEQVKQRALRNFDVIAELADNLVKTIGDKFMAEYLVAYGKRNDVGKVRKFYRQVTGYKPLPQKSK